MKVLFEVEIKDVTVSDMFYKFWAEVLRDGEHVFLGYVDGIHNRTDIMAFQRELEEGEAIRIALMNALEI